MNKPELILNPVGLDSVIQDLQIYLTANLPEIEIVFGKAFKNETKPGKYIPEVYTGNNEYLEIFANDSLKSFIFFDVEDNRNIEFTANTSKYKLIAIIRLIASANLKRIYPELIHRSTENLICDIETILNSYNSKNATWKLKRIIEGTKNIFSNYNYEITDKKINMQPFYNVSFEFSVNYDNFSKC